MNFKAIEDILILWAILFKLYLNDYYGSVRKWMKLKEKDLVGYENL